MDIHFADKMIYQAMIIVSQIIENWFSGVHYQVFRGFMLSWEPSGQGARAHFVSVEQLGGDDLESIVSPWL